MNAANRPGNGPVNEEGIDEVVEQARERFTQVAGEVRERVQQAGDTAGKRARRAADDLKRGAEIARERVAVTSDQLRQGYHEAEKRARGASRDVNDFVQENPARAVLMAAGIGFLVGLLVRRRDG